MSMPSSSGLEVTQRLYYSDSSMLLEYLSPKYGMPKKDILPHSLWLFFLGNTLQKRRTPINLRVALDKSTERWDLPVCLVGWGRHLLLSGWTLPLVSRRRRCCSKGMAAVLLGDPEGVATADGDGVTLFLHIHILIFLKI